MYNTPLGSRVLTAEDCYLRTLLNCLEHIKSGVTTVIDDVFHGDITIKENVDAVYQAYKDSGLRAMVTAAASDLPYYQTIPFLEKILPKRLKKELSEKVLETDEIFDVWSQLREKYAGRVSFAISTSAPQRCSDDFLKKAKELARELNVPYFTHTLETKVQEVTGYLFYGESLVDHMDRLQLLDPNTKLIHCVWLNKLDIDLVARRGVQVIHNPLSNLKLGSGIAPIAKLLARGVPVGLGTDNNNCNDSVNLIEAMKYAALIGKVNSGYYQNWIGAEDVLAMATTGGAACFGSGEIGELRAGAKADFAIFDLGTLSFFPSHNRLYQLVYAENGSSLNMVVVDGRILMEQGQVTIIDEADLKIRLLERHERILSTIAEQSKRAGELTDYIKQAYNLCLKISEISGLERA
jgi:guanine deaminase